MEQDMKHPKRAHIRDSVTCVFWLLSGPLTLKERNQSPRHPCVEMRHVGWGRVKFLWCNLFKCLKIWKQICLLVPWFFSSFLQSLLEELEAFDDYILLFALQTARDIFSIWTESYAAWYEDWVGECLDFPVLSGNSYYHSKCPSGYRLRVCTSSFLVFFSVFHFCFRAGLYKLWFFTVGWLPLSCCG